MKHLWKEAQGMFKFGFLQRESWATREQGGMDSFHRVPLHTSSILNYVTELLSEINK